METTTIIFARRDDGEVTVSAAGDDGELLYAGKVDAWQDISPGLLRSCVITVARMFGEQPKEKNSPA